MKIDNMKTHKKILEKLKTNPDGFSNEELLALAKVYEIQTWLKVTVCFDGKTAQELIDFVQAVATKHNRLPTEIGVQTSQYGLSLNFYTSVVTEKHSKDTLVTQLIYFIQDEIDEAESKSKVFEKLVTK